MREKSLIYEEGPVPPVRDVLEEGFHGRMVTAAAAFAHMGAGFGPERFLVEARRSGIVAGRSVRTSMRLFFLLLTLGGSIYLFVREHGDRRFAIGALVASSLGLLLQLRP